MIKKNSLPLKNGRMNMIHIDTWVQEDCTIGRLRCGDFHCFTLELPWEDNRRNISCIPAGHYVGKKYDSQKHGHVILLEGVPDRSYIEIHAGNYTRQIQGCILVGDAIKYLDSDFIPDVTNSRNTLNDLLSILPDQFTVTVERV
jgi:hypothetical protein